MGDDAEDSDARDRAAILARRQRFIALALTGLAAACADDGSTTTSPMPCLDAPQTESATMTGPTGGDTTASSMSGNVPCLGAVPETSSSDTTGMADATTSTGTGTDDTTSTGDGGSTGTSTGGTGESTGAPLPCLGVKPSADR